MISRRAFLRAATLFSSGSLCAPLINSGRCRLSAETPADYASRAVDLVRRSTVLDMLGLFTLDWRKWERWCSAPDAFTGADLRCIRDSGITVFHYAVSLRSHDKHAATRRWLDRCWRFLGYQREHFVPIRSFAELPRVKSSGKIGVLIGMQDSAHFRTVADVSSFRKAGQLTSQLTYNLRNRAGSGCREPNDDGLSPYGAALIGAMIAAGMKIDVSHCGPRTTMETLEVAGPHAIISHANCRALNPTQPRCKTDDVIRKLAAAGGVMGITGIRAFVKAKGEASINDVLDHFDHVARLVGVEHVGVGSDAGVDGGNGTLVSGLDGPDRMYRLAEGLMRRGYSDGDIEMILGGNFLRALTGRGPEPQLPSPPILDGTPIVRSPSPEAAT